MEIIKEINYDWMWKVGLVLLIIGIILFVICIIFDSELSVIGVPMLMIGIILFIAGIIQLNKPKFHVKLCDTYTVYELIEQCELVQYESNYGTWLVQFKEGNNEIN